MLLEKRIVNCNWNYQDFDHDYVATQELGFGKCKLSVQVPISSGYKSIEELAGKRIVTSFPNVAKRYFKQYDTPEKQTSKL